jgi:hypothetical protein
MSAKVKHSGQRFWRKGILPSNRRHLADHVDAAIKEITEDLGGISALTGAQRVMLAQLRRCLIFLALIDRWIADHAFIDDKGNLAGPMNAFYLSALNSSTRIVKDLAWSGGRRARRWKHTSKKSARRPRTGKLPRASPGGQGRGNRRLARAQRRRENDE